MNKFHLNIKWCCRILEMMISVSIIIAIGISLITLANGLKILYLHPLNMNSFQNFLGIAFNIIIGIEFIKMIFRYNVSTVVEVLLFAIARQLIVGHATVIESCIGVIAIAILFGIRKYLFIPEFDDDKEQ